jgi:hypothetical protein
MYRMVLVPHRAAAPADNRTAAGWAPALAVGGAALALLAALAAAGAAAGIALLWFLAAVGGMVPTPPELRWAAACGMVLGPAGTAAVLRARLPKTA